MKKLVVLCSLVFASQVFGQIDWTGNGKDGQWSTGANWSTGTVPPSGSHIRFYAAGGDIYITSNVQIQQMHVYGPADVILNIDEGVTFGCNNGGGTGIQTRGANTTINGPGKLALSTGGDANPLDCGALVGYTLTYNAEIVGISSLTDSHVETYISGTYDAGTVVMGCPTNAFTRGYNLITTGHTVVVPKLANLGQVSSLGNNLGFNFNYFATLRYTGTGDSTDRPFRMSGNSGGQVEQAGTGPLTLTGDIYNINASAQTIVLRGNSSSEASVTGSIYDAQGTLAVRKEGIGTWVLSGNNTFSGGLIINNGTLVLDSATAAGSAPITMGAGTALSVNRSAAASFTASFPAVSSSGNIKIAIAQPASGNSTVTFGGLTAAFVAITAPNAGTSASRIFITGLQNGPVGTWLTLNGQPAEYSSSTGLGLLSLPTQGLATKGSILPSNADTKAIINSVGAGLPIALTASPNYLHSLTQTVAADDATVDTAGKYLMLSEAAISALASNLTIGVSPKDGTLLPPLAIAPATPPPAPVDNSAIAALNPLVWYDPSEAATVSLFYGTVTNLANKGTAGPSMDAVVRSTFAPPAYATGSASHSALPMLRIHTNGQGLESRANTGISGNAPRTLFAVMTRDSATSITEVSLGTGDNRRRFTIILYNNNDTRFSIHGQDINVAAVAPATPTVLSMANGTQNGAPNGNNYSWQGFVNGSPTPSRTDNDMNTMDTPLYIGYLYNSTVSNNERGQVGEVLLFNRVLDATERETVENYLMAKWQLPPPAAPTAQAAALSLRNDSLAAPLTVNAAVAEPLGSAVSLLKWGLGDVVLAGGATLSGSVQIDDGTFTVASPAGAADSIYGVISGAGKLIKDGAGPLLLSAPADNLYLGGTDITGGTLVVGRSGALGLGPVTITDGATLDIGAGLVTDGITNANVFTVSGTGAGGVGAIINSGSVGQMNAFRNARITLADDTTFGGNGGRWDFRASTVVDLNGNTLTKIGTGRLYNFGGGGYCCYSNAPLASAKPALDIQQGEWGIELTGLIHPNDNLREILIGSEGRLGVYATANPINWKITPADGATIFTYGTDEYTNKNVIASGMALPGTLNLTTTANNYNKHFTGQLSGLGGLNVTNGGLRAMSLLSHPNNTFAGAVTVSNATVGLRYPGSLPVAPAAAAAKLFLLGDNSAVRVYAGGAGWTQSEVIELAESGVFASSALRERQLQIDVAPAETITLPTFAPSFAGGIEQFGNGTLVLDSDVTLLGGSIRTFGGTLFFTNDITATLDAGLYDVSFGDATPTDGTSSGYSRAILGGNAILKHTDRGYNTGSTAFYAAARNNRAVIDLQDNAQVSAKFIIGGVDSADAAMVGAVYQSGTTLWHALGGANNDNRLGRHGYGYWQLDSGDLIMKGTTILGGSENGNSVGLIRQSGGHIAFNGGLISAFPANGTITNAYNGQLGLSRGGRGVLHLEGGTFAHYGEMRILDETDNSSNNGTAIMTVTGTADVMVDRAIYIGHRNNGWAIVNLNGGKLTASHFQRKNRASSTVHVNFNGGTLSVTNNAGSNALFTRELDGSSNPSPTFAYVHSGGAAIDIGHELITRTIDIPLQAPDGLGVVAVNLASSGNGYIAPPYVNISGGNGNGATAIATIDRATGTITGIEVTNPGRGYTTAPSVTFVGGGGSGASATAAVASHIPDGGLTKTGPGTLILNAPNTYTGPTVVEEGTLVLGCPDALNMYSEIVVGDGTLNLGGYTVTNLKVTITGTGGIICGKIVTASASKTGPGTATLEAGIDFFQPELREPGLWEGFLSGRPNSTANLAQPLPKTTVVNTTLAANGYVGEGGTIEGKYWPNQSTWGYQGYIWNRNGTNETWTFVKSFDDDIYMTIDGIAYINDTQYDRLVKVNVPVGPGAHPIEIRFGQGTGNVGAMKISWWQPDPQKLSLGVDYLGRGEDVLANYEFIADDGSGDRLTLTAQVDIEYDPVLRILDGTLLLPSVLEEEAGLWEGRLSGAFNLTGANPCSAIEPTTTAVQGLGNTDSGPIFIRGKEWISNVTYIYTGYIWNRTADPVTWSFAENFDDNVWLKIGNTVVLSNMTWNGPSIGTITLDPGPHFFEARFGQGGGGAAGNVAGWWTDSSKTFLIDYQGRDEGVFANFEEAIDDGHGTLFTRTVRYPSDGYAGAAIGGEGGALDLGDKPRPGLILSPAGDDALGTMGLSGTANNALNGVTYRVTLGTGTDCDLITSAETLDLSGLTIAPSNLDSEYPKGNNYVIAIADGGFTGLPTLDFPESKWKVFRKGNQLILSSQGGTMLILR